MAQANLQPIQPSLNIADYREMMRRDHEFQPKVWWPVIEAGEQLAVASSLHFGNCHWSPSSEIPFEESPMSLIFGGRVIKELQDRFNASLNEHMRKNLQ